MTPDILVRDPEAPEAATQAAPEAQPEGAGPDPSSSEATVVAERPCPSCGAALAPDQDWCLECGSAAAGRSGGLPGWRTAAATIAICLTLASGAVAAAYAAINAEEAGPPAYTQVTAGVDDGPDLGAAPALAGPPAPAAPPADAAAPPPPVEPPPVADFPSTPPAPAPPPVTPVAPPALPVTPVTPSGDGGSDADSGNDGEQSGEQPAGKGDDAPLPPKEKPPVVAFDLAGATAATFDPAGHPAEAFTDPALALDGDRATAWTATLPAGELAAPEVGLTLDLGEAVAARRLVVVPTAPGTTIEVYGTTKRSAPASVDGWTELATRLDVQGRTRIPLGDGSERFRHLLVLFTAGPVDDSDSVGIAELELLVSGTADGGTPRTGASRSDGDASAAGGPTAADAPVEQEETSEALVREQEETSEPMAVREPDAGADETSAGE